MLKFGFIKQATNPEGRVRLVDSAGLRANYIFD